MVRINRVTWTIPSDLGGTGLTITSYKIYRATSPSGTYSLVDTTNASETSARSWDDTNVADSADYWYKVSAVNTVGEGSQSDLSAGLVGETFSSDVAVQTIDISSTYNATTVLQSQESKSYTATTALQSQESKSYTSTTAIQKQDIAETYTSTTVIQDTNIAVYDLLS